MKQEIFFTMCCLIITVYIISLIYIWLVPENTF